MSLARLRHGPSYWQVLTKLAAPLYVVNHHHQYEVKLVNSIIRILNIQRIFSEASPVSTHVPSMIWQAAHSQHWNSCDDAISILCEELRWQPYEKSAGASWKAPTDCRTSRFPTVPWLVSSVTSRQSRFVMTKRWCKHHPQPSAS